MKPICTDCKQDYLKEHKTELCRACRIDYYNKEAKRKRTKKNKER